MSAFWSIASVLPPEADVPGGAAVRLLLNIPLEFGREKLE
jgi:hypothetical protein